MHIRMKSHLSKFYSKKLDIKESSAFYKHLINKHGGMSTGTTFEDYFTVEIVKAYNKPMSKQTEEGTFMINIKGKLLNSKTEWHQPKLIRTTIHTGGAELAGGRIVSLPPLPRAGGQGPGARANLAAGRIVSTPPLPQAGGQGPVLRRSTRNNGN